MDYELLLNEIINIGKEMIKSGAETNRVEDSMYRMLESYDIGQCSVFAIQSNIQVTIRSKDGTFITQVRRVHRTGFNYDRLDYLNNLSRYICRNQPSVAERILSTWLPSWAVLDLACILDVIWKTHLWELWLLFWYWCGLDGV